MKIIIDIGHPAHVHYFKNFAKDFIKRDNEILFIVRNKESTIELIRRHNFNFLERGKGGNNVLSKILLLPFINLLIFKAALKFKPDLFLSFSSPYAAQVSCILRKAHIAFDDTEHAVWAQKLYRPFSDVILSPSCYDGFIVKKQILFESYMELCHLHPNSFTPNIEILNQIGINKDDKYVIIRFVAWNANHDVGQKGFSIDDKIELVKNLSKHCKVFISSEGKLPAELESYRLNIEPSSLHDILYYASLYIGEGSTTASESAVLGTPAIFVNSLKVGYCTELEKKYGLVYQLNDMDMILKNSIKILNNSESKSQYLQRRKTMLKSKIDPTRFMIWFIENWPESKKIMIEDPDYQLRFK